jgi:alpha-1,6-mannosyltransferase
MQLTESVFTLLLISVILLHLSVSPFTKVEESFNIQATHDILTYGFNIADPKAHLAKNYDHVDFPGSVPRTFVGAVTLSFFATMVQIVGRVRSSDELQFLGS